MLRGNNISASLINTISSEEEYTHRKVEGKLETHVEDRSPVNNPPVETEI
jgi:hypothetical protein